MLTERKQGDVSHLIWITIKIFIRVHLGSANISTLKVARAAIQTGAIAGNSRDGSRDDR